MRHVVLAALALTALVGCRYRSAEPTSPEPRAQTRADVPDRPTPEVDPALVDKPKGGRSRPLVIDFLNAGQGDCIHVACPNGNSIVVDCGSSGQPDPELVDIMAGLVADATEVRVVVTHADSDHYNRLEKALGGVEIVRLFVGGRASYFDGKKAEGWFSDHAAEYPVGPFDGSELECGEDVKVEVLAASLNAPEEKPSGAAKNNASIVLRLERSGFGILLSGDAYEDAERWMLDTHGSALRSDVLKLGHHGSATSTSREWVEAVQPSHVVITAGMHGGHKHPRCSVLDNLTATKLKGAPTEHAIGCYDGSAWATTTSNQSAWSTCDSGHVRLLVPAEGKPTIGPHVFPEDQAGNGAGEKCPVRYSR